MMPRSADRATYRRYRARLLAVERLGPKYRRRMIEGVARCLDLGRDIPKSWSAALDETEKALALRLASQHAASRRRRWIKAAIEPWFQLVVMAWSGLTMFANAVRAMWRSGGANASRRRPTRSNTKPHQFQRKENASGKKSQRNLP